MAMSRVLRLALLLLSLSPTGVLSAVNVTHLPGFPGPLPFQLETGYETVDDIEFFYYFVQSERNPSKDPLLFWLTGGPGCSSFTALATQLGPLRFVIAPYDGRLPSLAYNPYSWTKFANIVFLDSPVGTGFTFSRSAKAYDNIVESIFIKQICKFIAKWYENHPYFLSNPLYISGDSYSGKIVPIIAHELAASDGIPAFSNLKGYLVGNPITGGQFDQDSRYEFANRMGIISDESYEEILEKCEGEDYNNTHVQCTKAISEFNQTISEINEFYILDPYSLVTCHVVIASTHEIVNGDRRRSLGEESAKILDLPEAPDIRCQNYVYYLAYFWANDNSTRDALHIKKDSIREWVRCHRNQSYTLDIPSSLKYHHNLMQRGYRALIYSGDHDLVVPFVGTHAWIKSFNFSIVDDWRSWKVDGEVAGYTRKFEKDVTFATVKNAGHTAAEYQPKNCLSMFERWISYKRL